ncbi:ferrous iron transport protein B [Azotobacter vinelandii CA]|uniref:Ferrous iron transport protein B n=2 Tax=Azotobacter vinelandii TaxID=354 RepID=C1DJ35_AZOVD|nr:ferrous iron transporter B [Azotobacter vinelandii]ACO80854.1 ferrous iron transport protein B [Azotobacter vinelandii DJ]AGK13453.1 ferrous iron transport protein B [Azotobacter vinelandii CA]AGK17864.1 ferrous iron transport protein B [Azotobacter vinelandii CA6]WKN21649.1 ferrous iron transporter B [Azotobacter vinelandii]GLK60669.1 ferrous iron transporter B [Azotobacter vinelandii]
MSQSVLHFALVGNPNCGKTALFNCLTGARAKVANYAGVTVEKRSGPLAGLSRPAELIDLPGTYSLYVASPDEQVARRVILGEMPGEVRPDALVAVVDATNIKLGLRLVLELKALGLPMILVLNLADAARQRGINIRTDLLAERLGMPVVETVAVRRNGVAALQAALRTLALDLKSRTGSLGLPERGEAVESLYARIDALLADCVEAPASAPRWQDRLDALVMHPVLGLVILAATLLLMFQAVFAWAAPLMDGIEALVGWLGGQVGALLPEGILHDFVVDGLIAGMGSVLVFLPQIIILFAFILALEDSGYLPRAAFLLDRMMRGVGLSGRSFIPLLSSFACAVPGIMSTRSISNPHERLVTIMTAPLMTCSARLPVYALVIGAFVPQRTVWGLFNLQGVTLFCLYVAGIASAALVAWVCRRRQGKSESFPLLLELPNYRWPNLYHFLLGLKERAWIFLRRVGTIILALSIVLWFLATFPGAPEDAALPAIEYSFAGKLGALMQPLFEPLGFSWQMCIALIPAMAAREVAVSTLATVYAVGGGDAALGSTLAHSWSLPVALAYLAWFVYAPQCLSTIAVVRRETNSRRATLIFTAYLFALAYVAALLVRHLAAAWA